MLQKKPALILTFRRTMQAMAAEDFCRSHELPGRLIPLPREISAGCGLAWKAPPESKDSLCRALDEAGLAWEEAHILEV